MCDQELLLQKDSLKKKILVSVPLLAIEPIIVVSVFSRYNPFCAHRRLKPSRPDMPCCWRLHERLKYLSHWIGTACQDNSIIQIVGNL
jgi:hypothetical protein